MTCPRCNKVKQWIGTMRTCVNPNCDLYQAGVIFNQGPVVDGKVLDDPSKYKQTAFGWIKEDN